MIERHNISHPKALTDLAYRLIDNAAILIQRKSIVLITLSSHQFHQEFLLTPGIFWKTLYLQHFGVFIQVSESLAAPETEKRGITALTEAMTELSLKTGIIVTQNEERNIEIAAGTIKILPAWRFLLSLV